MRSIFKFELQIVQVLNGVLSGELLGWLVIMSTAIDRGKKEKLIDI